MKKKSNKEEINLVIKDDNNEIKISEPVKKYDMTPEMAKKKIIDYFNDVVNIKPDSKSKKEMVNHPSHYQGNKFEVIDVIEDYDLNFRLGNVVKYILRCGKKDEDVQELMKAKWYLEREIQKRLESHENKSQ